MLDFVGWLRAHNDALPDYEKVSFYGLDLYSLHASIESILNYLSKVHFNEQHVPAKIVV